MGRTRPRLALTCGEPAGIGPDICLAAATALAARGAPFDITFIADRDLLAARARQMQVSLPPEDSGFHIEHVPLAAPAVPGQLDPRNARWVLQLLDRAMEGCRLGHFDALVTAPVQKSVINDAGIAFTGHTEYLAAAFGTARPVMLLAAGTLRVALATTHLPLQQVPAAITAGLLDEVLDILQRDLVQRWQIATPRIGVCGLNPHAGEAGHLGREEIEVIAPAIQRARRRGAVAPGGAGSVRRGRRGGRPGPGPRILSRPRPRRTPPQLGRAQARPLTRCADRRRGARRWRRCAPAARAGSSRRWGCSG